MLNSFMLI